LFAYGPPDATAIPKPPSSHASFKSRLVLSFWYRLANPGCPGKEAVKTGVVVVGYLGNPTCIGLVIIQLSLVFMLFLETCLVIRITAVFKGVTGLTPPPKY